MAFVYYNPNPRRKQVIDCTIRALCRLEHLPWRVIFDEVCSIARDLCDMPSSDQVWQTYLYLLGYTKHIVPDFCPRCYSIKEFCHDHPHGSYMVKTSGHVVAVVDGDYYDTWNSGNRVPIYYWRKE